MKILIFQSFPLGKFLTIQAAILLTFVTADLRMGKHLFFLNSYTKTQKILISFQKTTFLKCKTFWLYEKALQQMKSYQKETKFPERTKKTLNTEARLE